MLLVIEIIWRRIMRLVINDEPVEDVDGSGSGLLLIIIMIMMMMIMMMMMMIIIIIIIIISQAAIRLCQAQRMPVDLRVECPLFLSCFNQNWDEWRNFSGCLQYQTS